MYSRRPEAILPRCAWESDGERALGGRARAPARGSATRHRTRRVHRRPRAARPPPRRHRAEPARARAHRVGGRGRGPPRRPAWPPCSCPPTPPRSAGCRSSSRTRASSIPCARRSSRRRSCPTRGSPWPWSWPTRRPEPRTQRTPCASTYDPLPAVSTMESALAADGPRAHPGRQRGRALYPARGRPRRRLRPRRRRRARALPRPPRRGHGDGDARHRRALGRGPRPGHGVVDHAGAPGAPAHARPLPRAPRARRARGHARHRRRLRAEGHRLPGGHPGAAARAPARAAGAVRGEPARAHARRHPGARPVARGGAGPHARPARSSRCATASPTTAAPSSRGASSCRSSPR